MNEYELLDERDALCAVLIERSPVKVIDLFEALQRCLPAGRIVPVDVALLRSDPARFVEMMSRERERMMAQDRRADATLREAACATAEACGRSSSRELEAALNCVALVVEELLVEDGWARSDAGAASVAMIAFQIGAIRSLLDSQDLSDASTAFMLSLTRMSASPRTGG